MDIVTRHPTILNAASQGISGAKPYILESDLSNDAKTLTLNHVSYINQNKLSGGDSIAYIIPDPIRNLPGFTDSDIISKFNHDASLLSVRRSYLDYILNIDFTSTVDAGNYLIKTKQLTTNIMLYLKQREPENFNIYLDTLRSCARVNYDGDIYRIWNLIVYSVPIISPELLNYQSLSIELLNMAHNDVDVALTEHSTAEWAMSREIRKFMYSNVYHHFNNHPYMITIGGGVLAVGTLKWAGVDSVEIIQKFGIIIVKIIANKIKGSSSARPLLGVESSSESTTTMVNSVTSNNDTPFSYWTAFGRFIYEITTGKRAND